MARYRPLISFFCLAGCATTGAQPAQTSTTAPTDQVAPHQTRIDHEEPVLAKCVADAYAGAGTVERVDGVISVDRTGLEPRYDVDPKLPGLLDCVVASQAPLERGSTSFRARRAGNVVEVVKVPKVESGDEEYDLPPEVPIGLSACMLKQANLRAPAEGAMLIRLEVAPGGEIEDITFIASTAQFDEGAKACAPVELADERIGGVDSRTVINLKHHVRLGEPVE